MTLSPGADASSQHGGFGDQHDGATHENLYLAARDLRVTSPAKYGTNNADGHADDVMPLAVDFSHSTSFKISQ